MKQTNNVLLAKPIILTDVLLDSDHPFIVKYFFIRFIIVETSWKKVRSLKFEQFFLGASLNRLVFRISYKSVKHSYESSERAQRKIYRARASLNKNNPARSLYALYGHQYSNGKTNDEKPRRLANSLEINNTKFHMFCGSFSVCW